MTTALLQERIRRLEAYVTLLETLVRPNVIAAVRPTMMGDTAPLPGKALEPVGLGPSVPYPEQDVLFTLAYCPRCHRQGCVCLTPEVGHDL